MSRSRLYYLTLWSVLTLSYALLPVTAHPIEKALNKNNDHGTQPTYYQTAGKQKLPTSYLDYLADKT